MLSIVFNFVGGSCAFVDESAHRFRVGGAQAGSFTDFIVMIEPRVAHGYEVGTAESLHRQGRGDSLATVRNAALSYACHGSTQETLDIRAGLHYRLKTRDQQHRHLSLSQVLGACPQNGHAAEELIADCSG